MLADINVFRPVYGHRGHAGTFGGHVPAGPGGRRGHIPIGMSPCPPSPSNLVEADREKRCQTCKTAKPLNGFPLHAGSHDGHRIHCRACLISGRYQPTPETPAQRKRRAERQGRRSWQRSHGQALREYGDRNPLKTAAVRALQTAVNCGRLQRGTRCQAAGCSSEKSIEGHHWSYAPEHHLAVLWVCAAHHRQGHARGFIVPAAGIPVHYGIIPGMEC